MRRAQSLRNHSHHARSTTMGSTDDLGMLREQPEESTEDALRRQLLEKDREMDKLLARTAALEDELSKRPPLEDFKKLQAEKKEVDWLFASSNRLNEKCMAKEQRDARWIGILERKLADIVGEDWQSTLNIASSSVLGELSNASTTSFLPQAESTTVLSSRTGTSTPDSSLFHPGPGGGGGMSFRSPSPTHSPILPTSITNTTITPSHFHHQRNPSTPSLSSPQRDGGAAAAAAGVATTTLAHIASLRALVLAFESEMDTREEKLNEDITRAQEAEARIASMRRTVLGEA